MDIRMTLMTNIHLAFSLLLPLLLSVTVEVHSTLQQNATMVGSTSSPWLKKLMDPRAPGCWNRPWICNRGERPPRRQCCRNHCVDVTKDINNCGFCGTMCPFEFQCCCGMCIDTNFNPFNCGRCGNRCSFGSLCFYGMCGYAQELPPRPFPIAPPLPRPPFPFPPKQPKPHPLHPPKPPKLPWPHPPKLPHLPPQPSPPVPGDDQLQPPLFE